MCPLTACRSFITRHSSLVICHSSVAAFDPIRTVVVELLFPDRHDLLQGIDREAAGLESRAAVRRCDDYSNAALAEFQAPQAVQNSDLMNVEPLFCATPDLLQLFQGHRLV